MPEDPVCHRMVAPANARGGRAVYQGRVYYFCSHACWHTFVRWSARYGRPGGPAAAGGAGQRAEAGPSSPSATA